MNWVPKIGRPLQICQPIKTPNRSSVSPEKRILFSKNKKGLKIFDLQALRGVKRNCLQSVAITSECASRLAVNRSDVVGSTAGAGWLVTDIVRGAVQIGRQRRVG